MFSRMSLLISAVLLMPLGVAVAAGDDAQKIDVNAMFEELLGPDERAVLATPDIADDLVLANRILDACRQLSKQQEFREHLCERAYRLASRRVEGSDVATAAMQLLMSIAPQRAGEARERIIDTYTQLYRRGRGEQRTEGGTKLVGWCRRFGDQYFLDGQYSAAMGMYQRAEAVARALRLDSRDDLNLRATTANALQNATLRLARSAERLTTAHDPFAVNEELTLAAIRELADFDTAAWYSQSAANPELAAMVRLARRRPAKMQPDELVKVGVWLTQMAEDATDYPKAQLLRRAIRMYSVYLQQPNLDEVHRLLADTRRTAAQRTLDSVSAPNINRRQIEED